MLLWALQMFGRNVIPAPTSWVYIPRWFQVTLLIQPVKPLDQCGRCILLECIVTRIHGFTTGHATHSIEILYTEKNVNCKFPVHPSSPAPGEQAITKENNVPVSDEYTRRDPRTVKYEDVFRRARRKYHNAKQLHSSDLLHR